jgi:hypothetical protein
MAKTSKKNVRALITQAGYEGQYVAFDPAKGRKIIASDCDAGVVIDKARKLGVAVPAVVFVPRRDVTYIY